MFVEYQVKLNEKYTPVLQCHSSFEATSYKKLQDITISSFISCCFTSGFRYLHQQISFFTTFQDLIQNYLKKDFRHEFSFFKGFT